MPVVTLTFSPCIDKSTSVPAFFPEKKLRCTPPKLEAGGGGINVARVLRRFDTDVIAVYPSGGYTGRYLDHLVRLEDVPCIHIPTGSETRENFIVFEQEKRQQFRFGMPATILSTEEWKACLEAVDRIPDISYIVVSGSLPDNPPPDLFARLAGMAETKNARLIIDTSGPALALAATEKSFLLKPNLSELAALSGLKWIEPDHVIEIARSWLNSSECEVLVLSMGSEGAMLMTRDRTHKASAPKVEMQSTVGAGDSMVAGMIYALLQGYDMKEVLCYGVACGTAATMHPGTELARKRDADELYQVICSTAT